MENSFKPNLFFIAHRMNVGNPSKPQHSQVDNSMEALDAVLDVTGESTEYSHIKGFECDVRLTCDNQLVVVHDGNIKTMTKTKIDKNISAMTYKELERIEITDSEKYYRGLHKRALLLPDSKRIREIISQKMQQSITIPKAFDMFDYLVSKNYKKEIVLEIKGSVGDKTKDAAVELINTFKNRLNFAVKGYNPEQLLAVGEQTGVRIGLLDDAFNYGQKEDINAEYIKNMPFDFYSILWQKVTPKKLLSFVENDKALYTWTIDSAFHMLGVFKSLERFYDKFGVLPQNTHLISNISVLLEEYISGKNQQIPLTKSIFEKYNKLFAVETGV
jgi:glycerophosphoryl diester phosphodiesterase